MSTFKTVAALLLGLLLFMQSALARGGGGCVEEGTLVSTPSGMVAVEQLRPGDRVWSVRDGKLQPAAVQAVTQVRPQQFIEINVAGSVLHVTAEHPVETGVGTFLAAGQLKPATQVDIWRDGHPASVVSRFIRRVPATRPAYDLLVMPGGTFIAGNVIVHNKGCFLPDTPILKPDGSSSAISSIKVGDQVMAFDPDGQIVSAQVQAVLAHEVDEYFVVTTSKVQLHVTAEHPFYVGEGRFKTLEALHAGDSVYALDSSAMTPQTILHIERRQEHVRVYNLQTEEPHTYFAAGVAVHNKGGCFAAGTSIATPTGAISIEKIAAGQQVLAVADANAVVTAIVQVVHVTRSEVLELQTERGTLRTTTEHPLRTTAGDYIPAGDLRVGDEVAYLEGSVIASAKVLALRAGPQQEVYNLTVDGPHTFIADGFVAHNKGGGCFIAGTRIAVPEGQLPIEQLRISDRVLCVDDRGALAETPVQAIYLQRSSTLQIETDQGQVTTTPEHPMRLAAGAFREAGALQVGEQLAWSDGSRIQAATVMALRPGPERTVYNLQVGEPHTFIADGFVVHNKGGGFHSSGRSYGRSGSSTTQPIGDAVGPLLMIGGIAAVVAFGLWRVSKAGADEDLDFCYSVSAVAPKAGKTERLLAYLSRKDTSMEPKRLKEVAQSTFKQLQSCWEHRQYDPMRPLMMGHLYAEHLSQIDAMKRQHEINVIANLLVEGVDLVDVRYTQDPQQRSFTALITARARDYYVDDRTSAFLRGDATAARFQEFWTFQFQNGNWLLREIEQTRESSILKQENLAETVSPEQLREIYGTETKHPAPSGPWRDKSTDVKASRVDQMLETLAKRDPAWNRQEMTLRVRKTFMDVMHAQERGNPEALPADQLLPEAAAELTREMQENKTQGLTLEYRNLCLRNVDLILVRDKPQPEFTARIGAHTQIVKRKDGAVLAQQEYVTPFQTYWTFVRSDGEWRLKEMRPQA